MAALDCVPEDAVSEPEISPEEVLVKLSCPVSHHMSVNMALFYQVISRYKAFRAEIKKLSAKVDDLEVEQNGELELIFTICVCHGANHVHTKTAMRHHLMNLRIPVRIILFPHAPAFTAHLSRLVINTISGFAADRKAFRLIG